MIQVDKADVLTELGKGSKLFIVDFKTLKVCRSDDIVMGAIVYYIDNPDAVFFKKVEE